MTGDLEADGSVAAGGGAGEEAGPERLSAAEQALLDAALGFYGAAEGVIDLGGSERPQVRRDADGFQAVRQAMSVLESCVRDAHAAGVAPERIAQVARIERDMVDLILRREAAAAPGPGEG